LSRNLASIGKARVEWGSTFSKSSPMIANQEFPVGAWDGLHRARAIAADFAANADWTNLCEAPNNSIENIRGKIAELHELIAERQIGDRDKEIVLQATTIFPEWSNLLVASPTSRPNTWMIVLIAHEVASLVASFYKNKYMRARPAQIATSLRPTIATPAHPSYPSGHALQAYLIAYCVRGLIPPGSGELCIDLANRIAKNREVAGVHFSDDTIASLNLAKKLFKRLRKVESYRAVWSDAKKEWLGTVALTTPIQA